MNRNILKYIVAVSVLLTECNLKDRNTAKTVLEQPETRLEIFDAILNNPDYLDQLGSMMNASGKGTSVCTGGISTLKRVWQSETMDSLLRNNKEMMRTMVERMVKKMESDTNACSMMCHRVMENERLKKYVMAHACQTTEKKGKTDKK